MQASQRVAPSLLLALGACVWLYSAAAATAQTTLVRELAKTDKVTVVLAVSGPQAEPAARAFEAMVRQHQDCKHKPGEGVLVRGVTDAATLIRDATAQKKGRPVTVIAFIVRREMAGPLPPEVAAAVPAGIDFATGTDTVVQLKVLQPNPLRYAGAVVAPDLARLERAAPELARVSGSHFSSLVLTRTWRTNRVAVFSDEASRTAVERWGAIDAEPRRIDRAAVQAALERIGTGDASRAEVDSLGALAREAPLQVWNDVQWRPLEERATVTPEQLAECVEVYFLDRSMTSAAVPEPAAQLLGVAPVEPTAVVVKRGEGPEGRTTVVFSAPNSVILRAKASRYRTVAAVPGSPLVEHVQDLRHVSPTALAVWGHNLTGDQLEQIRALLAQDVRAHLKLSVEERGEVLGLLQREVTTQDLLGDSDTRRKLRNEHGVRYLWVFRVNSLRGSTDYRATDVCTERAAPQPFNEMEPDTSWDEYDEGCVGGGAKEAIKRNWWKFERDHRAWVERKRQYEAQMVERAASTWQRQLTRSHAAEARAQLQLIDLASADVAGKVIWEQECSGSDRRSDVERSDTVVVRGVGNRPQSIPTPAGSSTCPEDMLLRAVRSAGAKGLAVLEETAWLPDGSAPPPSEPRPPSGEAPADPGDGGATASPPRSAPDPPPAPAPSSRPVVAGVVQGTVTVTRPRDLDVRPGDRAQVVLAETEVRDPQTGTLLKKAVAEAVLLRVTRVAQRSFDAVPFSPAEAAKLAKVQANQEVRLWRPAPPRPSAPPSRPHTGTRRKKP